jgi:hypothetical protein
MKSSVKTRNENKDFSFLSPASVKINISSQNQIELCTSHLMPSEAIKNDKIYDQWIFLGVFLLS